MAAATEIKRHLFSAKDYYLMGEAGILTEDDRVELIEGEIIDMPPIGDPHASVVLRLTVFLSELTRGKAFANVQNPLRLGGRSVPQPDVVLLRPREDFYRRPGPTPADVLLLIEVSDTTLAYDREVKLPLYAAAGVREVWIVDINSATVETYRNPDPSGTFANQSTFGRGRELSIEALPGVRFKIDDLLGPA